MDWREALRRLSTPTAEKDAEATEEESPEDQTSEDQVDDEVVADAEDGDEVQSDDVAEDPTEGVEETEDKDPVADSEESAEPGQGDDQIVTLDDGTETTLGELKASLFRQSDYTRKTQELAELRKNFQEEQSALKAEGEKRESLRVRVRKDAVLRDLVDRYPEAESEILDDLTVAERLLGDPSGSQRFAVEYELIAENPGIASRLAEAAESGSGEAEEILAKQRLADNIGAIFNATDAATRGLAEQLGATPEQADEVGRQLAEMVGIPTGALDTPELQQQMVDGADRLFTLLFQKDGDEYSVRDKVLRNQFSLLDIDQKVAEAEETAEAEQHDEAVDAALADADPQPKTPSGDGAVPEREVPARPKNFQEAMARLAGN